LHAADPARAPAGGPAGAGRAAEILFKASAPSADDTPMGELIRFPNCRAISSEADRLISERTRNASYWVRRWSEIHKRLCEADFEGANLALLEDSSLYLDGWLCDRNRAAIEARGF